MAYTGNPATILTDAVRLQIGDIYPDFEVLKDADYQYLLAKNNNNVNRAAIEAATTIMFLLSRWTRERTGDIEVYGSEWAKNYKAALLEYIRNPNITVLIATPYAGGISKSDMKANDENPDNARPAAYLGMTTDTPRYEEGSGNGYF